MVKEEVKEWFSKAEKDLDEAKFLFEKNRPLENIAFFIHEAVEKYIKSYLISNGWELEKTHDLVRLLREACKFEKSLEKFIPLTEEMANYYIESRYPIGYLVEYTKEEIEKSIKGTEALINSIKRLSE